MTGRHLEFTTSVRDEKTTVYTLSGRLYGNADGYGFQEAVRTRVSEGGNRVVIDLADVERIDSSGVGILVTVMYSTSNAGGSLVLASLSEYVKRVLGLALLLDHIDHAASVEAALAKLD